MLCSSGIDRHESENKEGHPLRVSFFSSNFPSVYPRGVVQKFGYGANGQVGRVHTQGTLLTRHCQVEVISIIKENPQEEEQVMVELDIV